MTETQKPYVIVVGVDYSPVSDLALRHAFELAAQKPKAELHIVNVVRTFGPMVQVDAPAEPSGFASVSMADASERLRTFAEQKLSAWRESQRPAPKPFTSVVSHIRLDAPAHEIAQIASDLEADLVVVGTHGRRGISRLLLGSVAEGVVKLAPCPVFVIRPRALPPDVPRIEPPCPRCVETRRASGGKELWCEQHRERHGQRHTYHQSDRVSSDSGFPLVSTH